MSLVETKTSMSSESIVADTDGKLFASSPYLVWNEGLVTAFREPADAISALSHEDRIVNTATVLSVLGFEYPVGDMTLVEGMLRAPWWSTVSSDGVVARGRPPEHREREASTAAVAKGLAERLLEEVTANVRGRDRVYVLLSGGMDSRIVAAIVSELQSTGVISVPVEAVTWGLPDSRDVAYAQRLAEFLGWKWNHAVMSATWFCDSFVPTSERLGGEVDPKHAHRWDWFGSVPPNSVVLAATWGDSIGRAEFSRRHVSCLSPLRPVDRFRFLRPDAFQMGFRRIAAELESQSASFSRPNEVVRIRELEQHVNYLRRMLGCSLDLIGDFANTAQLFTSRSVVEWMWSFSPRVRTDHVYVELLHQRAPRLLDFAWARTGTGYKEEGSSRDELTIAFHRYPRWLRSDYGDQLEALILQDDALASLQIFDMDQVQWGVEEFRREGPDDETTLATQLSFLAGLAHHVRTHELLPPELGGGGGANPLGAKVGARARQLVGRVTRPARMRVKSMSRR